MITFAINFACNFFYWRKRGFTVRRAWRLAKNTL